MRKITVGNEGRYNFHNASDITLHINDDMLIYRGDEVVAAELTPAQVRRINRHFCGISGCGCGSGPKEMEEVDYNKNIIHL